MLSREQHKTISKKSEVKVTLRRMS